MYFFTSDLAEDVALNVEVSSGSKKPQLGPTDNVRLGLEERSPPIRVGHVTASRSRTTSSTNGNGDNSNGSGLSFFSKLCSSPSSQQQPNFFEREEIIESVVGSVAAGGGTASAHTSASSMVGGPLMNSSSDFEDPSFPFHHVTHHHQSGVVSGMDLEAYGNNSKHPHIASQSNSEEDSGRDEEGEDDGGGGDIVQSLLMRTHSIEHVQVKFAGRVSYKNKASAINFDKSWLMNRDDWLMYNGSVAYCKPCRERFLPKVKGHHSRFVYGFYNGFSLDRILAHETSYFHEIAVRSWNKKHPSEKIRYVPRPRQRSSNSTQSLNSLKTTPKKHVKVLYPMSAASSGSAAGHSSSSTSSTSLKKSAPKKLTSPSASPKKKQKRPPKTASNQFGGHLPPASSGGGLMVGRVAARPPPKKRGRPRKIKKEEQD